MLIDDNILVVHWNENKDIIAVSYNKKGEKKRYYLLEKNDRKGLFSPFEPYSIIHFNTEVQLEKYILNNNLAFPVKNYYYWQE